jgi:hypothetical protein
MDGGVFDFWPDYHRKNSAKGGLPLRTASI